MNINTNRWNIIRYTLYVPIYDLTQRIFTSARKKSIEALKIKDGDNVLIVGAGTGLDLKYIQARCNITAIDITPAMVRQINKRKHKGSVNLRAMVMDGHSLSFPDESFDKIILHFILAVIPDPVACIKEVERVLKPDGCAIVLDKFICKNTDVSVIRKSINLITNFLFSDITRCFEVIASSADLHIISNIGAGLRGNIRLISTRKKPSAPITM